MTVGGWAYLSEKWWGLSVGMMKFPTEWKNKIHVPNHQPVMRISWDIVRQQLEYTNCDEKMEFWGRDLTKKSGGIVSYITGIQWD